MKTIKISGNITDSFGEPLLGVNIFPVVEGKNLNIGTITDRDGNFDWATDEISNDTIIKFSYLGKKPIELKANQLSNKNLVMLDAIDELNEVVVTATKKKNEQFTLQQKRIMAGAAIIAVTSLVAIYVYKSYK